MVYNVIDEFTRQHLAFRVVQRMGVVDVIDMLDLAVLAHGAPKVLRADNGPEFIAAAGTLGQRARHTPSIHTPRPTLAGRVRGVLTQRHA